MGIGSSRSRSSSSASSSPPVSTLSSLNTDVVPMMISPRTKSPRKASMSSSTSSWMSPSDTPRMSISENSKNRLSHKFSHKMKRLIIHPQPQTTPSTKNEYHYDDLPESPQYRQFRSDERTHHRTSTSTSTSISSNKPTPISRTIQILPSTPSYQQDSIWMSLEWILSTRSATHGLFDAYPYHCFDGFLVRTDPTYRPCLDFLHAETQFREKWIGFQPTQSNAHWKWNVMISEARTLYQTYVLPIHDFLSTEITLQYHNMGLHTQMNGDGDHEDMDHTLPFYHSNMFHGSVDEIMEKLRTGPFQTFIQTRHWKEMVR